VLARNLWLSLDPYMRWRVNDERSYALRAGLGAVMVGGTVGEVIESNNTAFTIGDYVVGFLGWQAQNPGEMVIA
jgi:NADPH-dependent curcumin reductase